MNIAISTEPSTDANELRAWRGGFERDAYGVIRRAIAPDTAAVAVEYMRILHDYYPALLAVEERLSSVGRYNDPLGESVLAVVAPKVRELTGLDLLPTYSFLRMYGKGGILARHVDRPSCEVSATLFLGSDSAWPIWVEVAGEPRAVNLAPGDLMVYRGCDVPHWRERFAGSHSVHLFLHFVEADGPNANLLYDERAGLGAPQTRLAPVRDQAGRRVRSLDTFASDGRAAFAGVRRNEPCPCGSGKRFKSCHGAK